MKDKHPSLSSLCRSDTHILDKLQRPYGTWVQELYSMYLLSYKKVTSGRILLFGFTLSGSQTPSAEARACFPFHVGRGVLYLIVRSLKIIISCELL